EGANRTTAGVVSGVLVHGQEDLLGEVLSFLPRSEDRKYQAVDEFAIPIIEQPQSGRIPRRGAQQLLVRLGRAIGGVVRSSVQTPFPLAQANEPTHERHLDYVRPSRTDAGPQGAPPPRMARPMTLARPSPMVPARRAAPVVRSTV